MGDTNIVDAFLCHKHELLLPWIIISWMANHTARSLDAWAIVCHSQVQHMQFCMQTGPYTVSASPMTSCTIFDGSTPHPSDPWATFFRRGSSKDLQIRPHSHQYSTVYSVRENAVPGPPGLSKRSEERPPWGPALGTEAWTWFSGLSSALKCVAPTFSPQLTLSQVSRTKKGQKVIHLRSTFLDYVTYLSSLFQPRFSNILSLTIPNLPEWGLPGTNVRLYLVVIMSFKYPLGTCI